MHKQVILVRTDLKLPPGKLAVQVAHASVECALKSGKANIAEWQAEGMKKSVLKVESEGELKEYWNRAKKEKLVTAMIKDAGLTVVKPGTLTCLGIGPAKEEEIDKVSGKLKLL